MRARRTPWWSFVLAAALGVLAGMGLAKYGEISGLPLVGAPWIVPVVLAVLGGVVLYMALQIHKYTTKDPVKRAQLKPLDPQKAFGTLVACKALGLAGAALAGWYGGQIIMSLPHGEAEFYSQAIIECVVACVVCVADMIVGIVGESGCGKSTLMKIIAGFIEPDSGEVEIGQTIKIGYFGQEVDIEPELRVIDYVKEAAEFVHTADGLVSASAMLERFLFPPEQQYSPVGKLSGGEKRRLYLLRVLMSAPNVLILDEPTNDLDVETLAILEDYLDGYDGIVITVSHDRYFLDRIAKRIFAFEGAGKIVQYEGGYTDYMNKRPQPATGKAVSENAASTGAQENTASDGTDSKEARKKKSMETWGHEKKLKFTYKEQKEYETIEADIEKLENRLSEIDDEMVKNATNFGKLNELTKEKEDLEGQLMEKMERWEYLEDLAQKIANLT